MNATYAYEPDAVLSPVLPGRIRSVHPRASPKRRLRVAFLQNGFLTSENVAAWSGLPFHMRRALENAGIEVIPVTTRETFGLRRWARHVYWRLLRGRRYLHRIDSVLLRDYARQIEQQLAELQVDAIFTPSSWLIAYLHTSVPVVLWSDATFARMIGFYEAFRNLAPRSIREGHHTELAALRRCTMAFFSSEWAARSAVEHYAISPDRVGVLSFGANMDSVPAATELDAIIAGRQRNRCRLLFVGVDWERKGAALAIEITRTLRFRGVRVELTLVGCRPPADLAVPPGVEIIHFVAKGTEEGRRRIDDLFRRSHLFILPTRADCTPCVFSEANSYALPCMTTDVGGIASVIRPGVNGQTFSLDASAGEYADYIEPLMQDRPRYEKLCRTSWEESAKRLSWQRSAERLKSLLDRICQVSHPAEQHV